VSVPAQVGRNAYNNALARARLSNQRIRRALEVLTDNPGPETRAVLVSKAALALIENEAALTELEQIGRQAKTLK
jgi:pyruvate kinase